MQVFIMRHGDAALDAASDSVRPLTVCGCDESRQMATWLKGQKVEIERVLVSPFLRAEQTLEEVGDCLNLPSSAEVLPELTPWRLDLLHSVTAQSETPLSEGHQRRIENLLKNLMPWRKRPLFAVRHQYRYRMAIRLEMGARSAAPVRSHWPDYPRRGLRQRLSHVRMIAPAHIWRSVSIPPSCSCASLKRCVNYWVTISAHI